MFESTAVAPDLYAASFTVPRWASRSFDVGSSPSRPRSGRGRLARLAFAAVGAVTIVVAASVILPSFERSAEASRPSQQCMATSCDPSYTVKESVGTSDAVAIGAPVTVAVPAAVSTVPCVSTGACTMAV